MSTFISSNVLTQIYYEKWVTVGILPFIEDIAKVHRFEKYMLSDSNVMAVTVQIVRPIIVS